MLETTVYYLHDRRIENYSYDAGGNRITESIEQREGQTKDYIYYPNSNRLMTNDKFAFVYDATGNLIEKGSSYTLWENNSKVSINPNEGEHWLYHYDLLNRLVKVEQNGEVVATYKYDETGLRLSKQTKEQTTYYVFSLNGQVIYEQEDTDYTEYLYVFNRHFARVDGNLLTEERTIYFYHTDHLGSTVLVTNELGQTVWNSEYTPFGQITKDDPGFNKAIKFTGKDLDPDTGLYYFNARWYDSDIGRFISEDPIKYGLNWYTYAISNPLMYVDLTGLSAKDWRYELVDYSARFFHAIKKAFVQTVNTFEVQFIELDESDATLTIIQAGIDVDRREHWVDPDEGGLYSQGIAVNVKGNVGREGLGGSVSLRLIGVGYQMPRKYIFDERDDVNYSVAPSFPTGVSFSWGLDTLEGSIKLGVFEFSLNRKIEIAE